MIAALMAVIHVAGFFPTINGYALHSVTKIQVKTSLVYKFRRARQDEYEHLISREIAAINNRIGFFFETVVCVEEKYLPLTGTSIC